VLKGTRSEGETGLGVYRALNQGDEFALRL